MNLVKITLIICAVLCISSCGKVIDSGISVEDCNSAFVVSFVMNNLEARDNYPEKYEQLHEIVTKTVDKKTGKRWCKAETATIGLEKIPGIDKQAPSPAVVFYTVEKTSAGTTLVTVTMLNFIR